MAGPTQAVSDDLKKLWGEFSSFRSVEFSTFRSEFAGFRAQVNVQLALIKWVGVFFSGILVALVGAAVNIAWNASALNSDVKQQGMQISKIEKGSEAILEKLDRIERRFDALNAILEREFPPRKGQPKSGG